MELVGRYDCRPAPMPRRSFSSVCTELMGVWRGQSKRRWLGSRRLPTGCVKAASSLSRRLVWKECLGRTSAVNARNASGQPPNGGERTFNQGFSVLGVRLRHGRGLWASSAVTLMNAHAAGCAGNVGRQIIRTSARIPSRHIARSAGLKGRRELRLYGKSMNEHKLEDGSLSA